MPKLEIELTPAEYAALIVHAGDVDPAKALAAMPIVMSRMAERHEAERAAWLRRDTVLQLAANTESLALIRVCGGFQNAAKLMDACMVTAASGDEMMLSSKFLAAATGIADQCAGEATERERAGWEIIYPLLKEKADATKS